VRLAQDSARIAARVLRHEWTVAVLACLAVAAFLSRASLADPSHTLPHDVWDPSFEAYLVAWDGHALLHNPLGIWQINAFYPAPDGLAFSDSLLGYAPFAVIGIGPEAAMLRYNLLFVAAQAMMLFGGYALARQLGLRPGAAVLAAVAVAVPPWRLAQTGHLNIVSTGGILSPSPCSRAVTGSGGCASPISRHPPGRAGSWPGGWSPPGS
jgi:hypothetical protein